MWPAETVGGRPVRRAGRRTGRLGSRRGQGVPFLSDSPRKERPVTDPDDSLRVSDAERDQTLRVLGDHAAVGRLTLEELEERSGRALTARTRGELAALTGDLPVEKDQDRPAPAPARKPVRWRVM